MLSPASAGGHHEKLDVRSLCLIRETLARHNALADFAFAMQGLGSGPISLFGNEAQQAAYPNDVATGEKIAAFSLSEPEAGSDVAAMSCSARREGDEWVLSGTKTWIPTPVSRTFTLCLRAPTTRVVLKVLVASSSRRALPDSR